MTLGKEGPLYRIALPFEKWAERDQWGNPRGMLAEAFGAQEGTKIYTEGTSAVVSTTIRIWEMVGGEGSLVREPRPTLRRVDSASETG